ncbi:MAG: hypothetical protein JW754_01610 [Candidatus Aenigmarchaeota archaeon]|nr:hypothetical protein [Candidatus Aenigmarchaeota archaeon]
MGSVYADIHDKLGAGVNWDNYPVLEGDSLPETGIPGLFLGLAKEPYKEQMTLVATAADKFKLSEIQVHDLIKMAVVGHFAFFPSSEKSIECSYLTWCEIFQMDPDQGYLSELKQLSK